MKRRLPHPLLALFVLAAVLSSPALRAQVVTYTWTGAYGYSWADYEENWANNEVPPSENVTTTRVHYGHAFTTTVQYNDMYAWQIEFSGTNQAYDVHGDADTTHIGAGGIIYNLTAPVTSSLDGRIRLEADQTWDVRSGTLVIGDEVSDHYYDYGTSSYVGQDLRITKTGAGTLEFDSNASGYYWYGGLTLSEGRVAIHSSEGNDPVGRGTLTFDGGTLVALPYTNSYYYYNDYYPVYLDNDVVSHGLISTRNEVDLHIGYSGEGSTTIELAADTTVHNEGRPLFLQGNITESGGARSLTASGPGAVILTGNNSYTGGTIATNGVLIFGNAYAIPSNNLDSGSVGHLTAGTNGYIGFGDSSYTESIQSYFIDDFAKAASTGTIGFDTDPDNSTPNIFSGTIDLTGFSASARLGSATRAILSGDITPQGAAYRFGGGGGWLQVDSALTGARSLVLDSPAALPLTVRLTNGDNSYTGGTSVTNSALIFGAVENYAAPAAMGTGNGDALVTVSGLSMSYATFPTGTRDVSINAGGYVGFEYWGDQSDTNFIANSLLKIHTASVGAVGFDNISLLTVPIDLSSFTNALYLATATPGDNGPGLTVSGPITPAGGASAPYRFAGYKGGALEVASTLTGANGVHIGDPNSPGTFGDFVNREYSKVGLTGNNSGLTGNITLYAGELYIGQHETDGVVGTDPTHALGTGTLVVQGMDLPPEWSAAADEEPTPGLGSLAYDVIVPNAIALNSDVHIAAGSSLQLTGRISGEGEIYLLDGEYEGDWTWLTLSNNANDFSGGVYLGLNSGLDVNADHALGTGPLGFGRSSSSEVYFNTTAPVVHGLVSAETSDYASLYTTQPDTVLTIDQSFDSTFQGEFRSEAAGDTQSLRLVKTGTGTLTFADGGMYYYTGTVEPTLPDSPLVSLQVNQGTLVLNNEFYTGETSGNTVWVHGGTLALANQAYVYNPVVVDNGGRLAGTGHFTSAIKIGSGAILSPGLAGQFDIGRLQFNHLELDAGGLYEWHVMDATGTSATGSDLISVYGEGTLVLCSSAETPFTIKVISLTAAGAAGALAGFDPSQYYTWKLFAYDYLSGTFDPNAFLIDATGFANSLAFDARGPGYFSVSLEENALMLNFTPVPEPSTCALLLTGLALVGWTVWRRRA